ncbi:MAG TPA: hypothetical protein VFO14_25695 [Vicinamibacterales bacterium]|jgi:hypothetical protein|nr:hypothetical protein [Vicinamibacterales bacterium]
MLWFFERKQKRLRYEIRREMQGPSYELVITHPDGREEVETFPDPSAALARSEHLRRALVDAGWQSPPAKSRARSTA